MTIAVHISLTGTQNEISSNFNYNCFTILAAKFPLQHFIFIFDKPFQPSLIKEKNITAVLLGPQVKNRLLQHYFYNFKIPRILNKYNATLFVSTDICSLRTDVPQYLIVDDLSFLKKKTHFSKTDVRYLKRYTRFFVRKASSIATINPYLKKLILKWYNVAEDKINVIQNGIDSAFKPFDNELADKIRNRFTEGKAYFLFFVTPASSSNVITILKAFSVFKKWQKSGMQLVLLFSLSVKETTIKELSSYKYRADVKILTAENTQVEAELIASAYASIYLPEIEITETQGLKSIASGIPLITASNDFCKSIYNDGAIYSVTDEKEIADKMMLLYKDENHRSQLINTGKAIAAGHSWENTATLLWQTIQGDTVV